VSIDNIDILISGTRDAGYEVRVINSPQGRTDEAVKLPLQFDNADTLRFLDIALSTSIDGIPENTLLDTIGSAIYRALIFDDRIQDIIGKASAVATVQNRDLRLRFQVEPKELRRLPWELLYRNPEGFLCIAPLNSIARYVAVGAQTIRALLTQPPLKVLIVTASPRGFPPLDMDKEIGLIRQAISAADPDEQLIAVEEVRNPSISAVRSMIRDKGIHILHFIGHGDFRTQQPVLAFADAAGEFLPVTDEVFAVNVAGADSLRLVFLNACDSAIEDTATPLLGIAPKLLQRTNIPAVMAMQTVIRDDSAIAFSQHFYQELAKGGDVDRAVREGRLAVYNLHSGKARDFAVPVLFLRAAEARLIDFPERQRERVIEQVSAGIQAVDQLRTNGWMDSDAAALDRWQKRLGELAGIYTRIANWKSLHDIFQELENTFDLVSREVGRVNPQSPDFAEVYTPWTLFLTGIEGLKIIASDKQTAIIQTPFVEREDGAIQGDPWIVEVLAAQRRFDEALTMGNVPALNRNARDIRRVLETYSNASDRALYDESRKLVVSPGGTLLDALATFSAGAETDTKRSQAINQMQQAVQTISTLHQDLLDQIHLHDLFQNAEDVFRRVRDELRGQPSTWDIQDIDDAWRFCRTSVLDSRLFPYGEAQGSLIRNNGHLSGQPWAVELYVQSGVMDAAVDTALETGGVVGLGDAARKFDQLLRRHFFIADKSLKDLTAELQRLAGQLLPLASSAI
jgi:hypothetical protein